MKRFLPICLCLVVTASVSNGAPMPRQQARTEKPAATAVAAAIRTLRFLFGIAPTGDGLTPPLPGPGGQRTSCCK